MPAHGYYSKEETQKRAASAKKKLDHIRIHHADNGGHIVEHHYMSDGGMYHEPEQHIFAEHEGDKMLMHVAKHMKVKHPDSAGEAESGGPPKGPNVENSGVEGEDEY